MSEELLEPHPEDLAEALRAFGYDLPTALADLVDNSIAAGASTVKIEYSSDPDDAWLAVVDDGRGMDVAELRSAMRFAKDPGQERSFGDLGRFGLGLKTASLSQVRRLTVLSRGQVDTFAGMTWDLDHIRQCRKWMAIAEPDPEALKIAQLLEFDHRGTLVIWRKADKLGVGPAMSRRVIEAGRQLSLLFHRFMESGRLNLQVGQRALRPMDPYLRGNPLTQDRGYEDLQHDGCRVRVNPVVLPHPTRLTRQESELASGPGGLLARQGFYVYRGGRLVTAGGWLGLAGLHNTQHTRLARIAVEIPPEADLAWKVDVRKSTVRPPAPLAGRLAELAEDVRVRSQRVFTHRGTPRPSSPDMAAVKPVWEQVRRLGRDEFAISREHPLIADALASPSASLIEGILKMIEATLPVDLINSNHATSLSSPEHTDSGYRDDVDDILQAFRAMLAGLPDDRDRRASLAEALADAEPFSRYPGLIREILDADSAEEQ